VRSIAGRSATRRQSTLRVIGLDGEVTAGAPSTTKTYCYLATLGEKKDVTVQLMQIPRRPGPAARKHPSGFAPSLHMQKLFNVLATPACPSGSTATSPRSSMPSPHSCRVWTMARL
jgi:hypothetical protein